MLLQSRKLAGTWKSHAGNVSESLKGMFGGQININQLTFFEKLLVKLDKEMRKRNLS